jgi:hypothetical protein
MPDPRELLVSSLNIVGVITGIRRPGHAPNRSVWLKFWVPDRNGGTKEAEVVAWEAEQPEGYAALSRFEVGNAVTLPVVITATMGTVYYRLDDVTFAKWSAAPQD